MKSRKIILSLILLITIFLSLEKVDILTIKDETHNKEYKYCLEEKKFTIGFIHSVMLTPVEEIFTSTEDNKLNLIETTYKSYGVGLPFLPSEGEMEIVDGNFILKINRFFKNISFRVSEISKHYLKINGETYQLINLVGNETAKITLNIEKKYRFKYRMGSNKI